MDLNAGGAEVPLLRNIWHLVRKTCFMAKSTPKNTKHNIKNKKMGGWRDLE